MLNKEEKIRFSGKLQESELFCQFKSFIMNIKCQKKPANFYLISILRSFSYFYLKSPIYFNEPLHLIAEYCPCQEDGGLEDGADQAVQGVVVLGV